MSKSRSKGNKPANVRKSSDHKATTRYLQLKQEAAQAANVREWERATELLQALLEQQPEDIEAQEILARVYHHSGQIEKAKSVLKTLLEAQPQLTASQARLAQILTAEGRFEEALPFAERALAIHPDFPEALSTKANILHALGRFSDAFQIARHLTQLQPDNYVHWNNAGNFLRDLGKFDEAESYYKRSMSLTNEDTRPFANLLTTMHYRPDTSEFEIADFCREWEKRFAPGAPPARPVPADKDAARKLNVGMISDGFRNHPVGRMIIAALEKLPKHAYKLHAYSTSNIADDITRRFKKICVWQTVNHLNEQELAQKVREDEIDILIDLAGYHNNTRMLTMAMQPAPLLVKWVGGLINTTGLSTIDYLITDQIESPTGDDRYYTEKLIRMPGDYICYEPPGYLAPLGQPPAMKNGYITLGCFNNPTKINIPLLRQWALIMHELPNSHLFLKGMQYSSEELCDHVRDILLQEGVESSRIIFEGLSPHAHVFRAYNRVDIALDPWPYSGGLTTCEAFTMGVPVVTMPGPTFAGRHSATHLVNAGMQELVTHSWKEYRARVIELASDLNSLATIRSHLRTVLLQSPVCDADTFAGHLNNALRAIWQRYTEGKEPAALSFNEDGQIIFEGEKEASILQHPEASTKKESNHNFRWEFSGKVIAIDHGAQVFDTPIAKKMLAMNTMEVIVFDPASIHLKNPLNEYKGVHYYPNTVLSDGTPATLYACQSEKSSGTLKPSFPKRSTKVQSSDLNILAELPIRSVALDTVNNLPSLDWIILDDLNDSAKVLEFGTKSLHDSLVIQARIALIPNRDQQLDFTQISHWAQRNGFRFYSLINHHYESNTDISQLYQASTTRELTSADAVFIPNQARIESLDSNRATKLAFILSTFYEANDLSFSILKSISDDIADRFLTAKGIIQRKSSAYINSSKENEYKLVVGVPIYNEESYIKESIESLLAQDAENVHYFISDNKSTDRTFEIVNDLIKNDSRFTIHQHKKNSGAATNFIEIFERTYSEYFMWLGGHDYISDGFVNNGIKKLDECEFTSMVTGQPVAILDNINLGVIEDAIYDFSDTNPVNRYLKSVAQLKNCSIFHSIFRRSNLHNFDFRTTISADHVIISHLLWFGKTSYMDGESYYRRYFSSRNSSQEERITGHAGKLQRSDFIQYYLDDFSNLAKDMPAAQVNNYIDIIEKVLNKRFLGIEVT